MQEWSSGNPEQDFLAFFFLALRSPEHSQWTLDNATRIFLPAFQLGTYRLWMEDGRLVAGITWTGMSPEAFQEFEETKWLWPRHWQSGPDPVVIDLIAPYGHCFRVSRQMQRYFGQTYGRRPIRWMRAKRGWQRGWCNGVVDSRQTA